MSKDDLLTSPSGDAVASIVVDQLDAGLGSGLGAWVGKTFIDVAFTARTNEPGGTSVLEGKR